MHNLLQDLDLGTHLFVKVPQPGDSEGIFSVFESSWSELAGLSPHYPF